MSQEKTSVPGMEIQYYANKKEQYVFENYNS